MGQVFPGDPGPVHVENGVNHLPDGGTGRLAGGPPVEAGLLPGEQGRPDQRPASVGDVGWVSTASGHELRSTLDES